MAVTIAGESELGDHLIFMALFLTHAAEADAGEVTLEIAEAAISESRQSMQGAMQAGGHKSPGGET